jgi:hypothetical protein
LVGISIEAVGHCAVWELKQYWLFQCTHTGISPLIRDFLTLFQFSVYTSFTSSVTLILKYFICLFIYVASQMIVAVASSFCYFAVGVQKCFWLSCSIFVFCNFPVFTFSPTSLSTT